MTERLRQAIDDAISNDPKKGDTLDVDCGDLRAQIDVIDAGPVGVSIERIKVSGPDGQVAERTHSLARSLSPAGERVVPVEVAPNLGCARLRSNPDDMKHNRFYDVEVDAGSIEITRQQVGEDGQRTPLHFDLTREQLGEIADSLEDAFAQPEKDDD